MGKSEKKHYHTWSYNHESGKYVCSGSGCDAVCEPRDMTDKWSGDNPGWEYQENI